MEPRVSSPVLVGRSGQLSALDAALAEAGRGQPSAVMIGGEAGVGKTRLVREFAERSRGTGARVLTGGKVAWVWVPLIRGNLAPGDRPGRPGLLPRGWRGC